MITRKNNNFKKIIFAAFILIIFIMALRYYLRSGDSPGSRGVLPAGETRVSSAPEKIPQSGSANLQPAAAPPRIPKTVGSTSAETSESSEAALNAQTTASAQSAAQPAPHLIKQIEPPGKKGIITGNGVNVRRESRIDAANSNVVTKVNKGDQVQIIGAEKPANDNKQWYNIKLKNGKTGFVREDLIKIE